MWEEPGKCWKCLTMLVVVDKNQKDKQRSRILSRALDCEQLLQFTLMSPRGPRGLHYNRCRLDNYFFFTHDDDDDNGANDDRF